MPEHLGGTYNGAQNMSHDRWARVFAPVDVRLIPDQYLPSGEDRMVVTGRCTGTARVTDKPLSAAFPHIRRFGDGRVSELVQITDTAGRQQALHDHRR